MRFEISTMIYSKAYKRLIF